MIKVYIRNVDFSNHLEIAFIDERDGKRYLAKPVELIFEELKDSDFDSPPTMRLARLYADEFLKAMAEALDERGVKTENDFKIQGLLEAREYHLEDMRRLVFENRRQNV